ncbi:hypothetical protein AVEN_28325-1 [Araneus ventricosus]|uniref:Uncharacterized protein n=1 Tax=Araneus ventricosus TaxID=182803 RepID=A0A4Y2DK46_ARAVE|nr:hypothetical protein AVEN_28325-1 [Araneus ventricosus]
MPAAANNGPLSLLTDLATLATNRRFPKMQFFCRYHYEESRSGFLQRFLCDVTHCQKHYKYTAVVFDGERVWSANDLRDHLDFRLQCELESW